MCLYHTLFNFSYYIVFTFIISKKIQRIMIDTGQPFLKYWRVLVRNIVCIFWEEYCRCLELTSTSDRREGTYPPDGLLSGHDDVYWFGQSPYVQWERGHVTQELVRGNTKCSREGGSPKSLCLSVWRECRELDEGWRRWLALPGDVDAPLHETYLPFYSQGGLHTIHAEEAKRKGRRKDGHGGPRKIMAAAVVVVLLLSFRDVRRGGRCSAAWPGTRDGAGLSMRVWPTHGTGPGRMGVGATVGSLRRPTMQAWRMTAQARWQQYGSSHPVDGH